MGATRHYWGQSAVAGLLASGAILLGRPLLLVGAAGVGAWLLVRQAHYARQVSRIEDGLTVEQSLGREIVTIGEEVTMTLEASLDQPVSVDLTVDASPPIGSSGPATDQRRITIPTGERTASTTFLVQPEVAGRQQVNGVTVTIESDLFTSTYQTGSTPSFVVQPRRPRNIHVGTGGTQIASSFVESVSGSRSTGLDPAGIRKYTAGDTISRIDWKTTARLQQPHVVEFEAETDYRTTLVVDHRATMGLGPDGERKLDYARQVALASLEGAREAGEPISLFCVGDHGLTTHQVPNSTPSHYTRVRTRLYDLEPTAGETATRSETAHRRVAQAKQRAKRLHGEDSPFASKVVPYLSEATEYVTRLGADPLYAAVRTELQRNHEADVLVFLTDDEHRTEVYESVRAVRTGNDRVVVFLFPSVLFEPGGLMDLDDAYEQYLDFDEFRRDLASIDGVTAFEVGPRDRVEALQMRPRRRTRV